MRITAEYAIFATMSATGSIFLNNLTTVDFAFYQADQGIYGESFQLDAELTGLIDHQGFVLDFSVAKKSIKKYVDDVLDHKLAVPAQFAPKAADNTARLALELPTKHGQITYTCPPSAVVAVHTESITRTALEAFLADGLRTVLPDTLTEIRIFLREDPRWVNEANYRYTHGLQYHAGNCQRLYHGHRNPIEVYEDGNRARDVESWLAGEFAGRHFIARPTIQDETADTYTVAYLSDQGHFGSNLPKAIAIVLEDEPSVEHIANYAKKIAQREFPGRSFRIKAYEGLNKGAFSS